MLIPSYALYWKVLLQ